MDTTVKNTDSFFQTTRSIFSNLLFVFRHIYRWDHTLFFTVGSHSLFLALSPFVWIIAPKLLIDELLGEGSLWTLGAILAGAMLLSSLTQYFTAYNMGAYRMKMSNIRFHFIELINDKAMSMDYRHTEDPEVLNKINLAWRTVRNPYEGVGAVLQKIFTLLGGTLGFVGYITLIFNLHPLILLYLLVNVSISFYLTLKAKKYEQDQRPLLSDKERKAYYINRTMSDFQYGKDIRIYRLKDLLVSKRRQYDSERVAIRQDIQQYIFKTSLLDALLLLIREGIVYSYLVWAVLNDSLSLGNFTLYAVSIYSFANWMNTLLQDLAQMRIGCLQVDDLRDFLDIEDMARPTEHHPIPTQLPYEIEFRQVSFRYPNSERYLFRDLSFTIKKGQRLAIVGVNGAGKTTLVKLLTRLYQPTSGQILVNGVDISLFDQAEYARIFSVVFQEIKMFAFNVAENVSFQEAYSADRVWGALEQAGLADKIHSLKKGLHTSVLKILDDEGVEFSGGENQKLALARALYKNGEIVVLDEPTAALDPLAEYQLYLNFNEMIGDRTAIYISHRLSSTRFCDQVAFFEDGAIKELGTHEELMALDGLYAHMFQIQAQYYQNTPVSRAAVGGG